MQLVKKILLISIFIFGANAAAQGFAKYDAFGRNNDLTGKTVVPCPPQGKKTAVLLLIGQSQAGNHAQQKHRSQFGDKLVNFYDGACTIAQSPLLGSTGKLGESWTLLGNKMLASGDYDQVVLIPLGMGSTQIFRWEKSGDINLQLMTVIAQAKRHYKITHVLWHQGENDHFKKTGEAEYTRSFNSLLESMRESGIESPVFVSVATKCHGDWSQDNPIARAQRAMVNPKRRVFAGIDSDSLLTAADRYDGCHFAASGQEKSANAWLAAIRQAKK